MQLVYIHELILKRASPLFFNGPAASEAASSSNLAALASSLSSSWPMAIGAHADFASAPASPAVSRACA
jgi:hypothetical protein